MSLWLAVSLVRAAEPADQSDYLIQNWQIEDGLPQSSVLSIAQTPDGYLWLATFGGLARFDGVRFTVFDNSNLPGLPDNRLVRLAVDKAGGLWLVTERNEVARLLHGHCRVFGENDGVPAEGVRWVAADGQGQIRLAGGNRGLWRWTEECFVADPLPPNFSELPFRMQATGQGENSWFSHPRGVLRAEGRNLVPLPELAGMSDAAGNPICTSHDGGLWMIGPTAVRKHHAGRWLAAAWPSPDFKGAVVDVREDFAGNVWVATYRNGLFRFNLADGWLHFTVESGLTTLNLRSLFCDR